MLPLDDHKVGHVLVIKPDAKRLDAACVSDFKNHLFDRISKGETAIVLDLSAVTFLDSSGLGAIVSSRKALDLHGDLVLAGVREAVLSLLALTRMNKVFQIYQTNEEAVNALVSKKEFLERRTRARVVTLNLDSKLENVFMVGLAVRGIVTDLELSAIDTYQIEVSVVEAINNVVQHAYGGESGHNIEITISLKEDSLVIQICDSGRAINTAETPKLEFAPDDIQALPESNMGRFIIQSVMDEVTATSISGKNVLTMIKRFTPRAVAKDKPDNS